ncbi:ribonuclease H-like domain-containing protein [Tanacetum coccineum]
MIQLYASITSSLVAYTDADWDGFPTTRRSTSGYCVFLGDNLLSWSAERQHTPSRSSAEVEYKGVANVVAKIAWIHNLLGELHTPLLSATLVYCDNVKAIYMIANSVQHQQTKHIKIDIHFVRDMVARSQVRVLYVPSRYQYADIFTKGLPSALFEEFHTSLSKLSEELNRLHPSVKEVERLGKKCEDLEAERESLLSKESSFREEVDTLSSKLKIADLKKVELVRDFLPLAVKKLLSPEHFNSALGDLQQKAIIFGRSQALDEVHGLGHS